MFQDLASKVKELNNTLKTRVVNTSKSFESRPRIYTTQIRSDSKCILDAIAVQRSQFHVRNVRNIDTVLKRGEQSRGTSPYQR